MTETKQTSNSPSKNQPSGGALGLLTALGAGTALWALFQWAELLIVRLGGDSFCSISETLDCQAVWDSALASAIHGTTGVPVAGWGLVWGLVALALPLWCLVARAEQKPLCGSLEAVALTALAGVATSLVMATASLLAGKLCLTCLGTYVLVIAYAVITARIWLQSGAPKLWPGLKLAVGATVVIYLGVLMPGLRTPMSGDKQGIEHVEQAMPPQTAPTTPPATTATPPQTTPATAATPPQTTPSTPPSTTVPLAERHVLYGVDLGEFIKSLPPQALQSLSDSLYIYRNAQMLPGQPPRALDGPENAKVRITDFKDILCGHCAALHETTEILKQRLPREILAIDSRHFPLDGSCNSAIKAPPKSPVRCLAAKAQICMEGRPGSDVFTGMLFARQQDLNEELVYTLASPHIAREELSSCVSSSETMKKLEKDIEWAVSLNLEGTPLVLVNGRKATSFAPFLYAIILTEGDAEHPVFASLPPPNATAHMH